MPSPRELFLICVALSYNIAFSSLYIQIPGLYGDRGLLPVKNVIRNSPRNLQDFLDQPSLLRVGYQYGLDVESALDIVCLLGVLISFLAILLSQIRTSFVFFVLWILYMSLYSVGQTFLWFQWDILLLETGFIALIVAPLKLFGMPSAHHHDRVSMFLVKWLLFRLMFASGTVKLQSNCPTWWGLTALDWHFESQCIPTPLAWYFHHLPQWFKMLSNALVFIFQIPVAFLFFSPIRDLRLFAFCAQVSLQVLILVSGNYNFFNLLTIVLCFSLVEEEDCNMSKRHQTHCRWSKILSFFPCAVSTVVYAVLAFYSQKYFGIQVANGKLDTKIMFTREQFDEFTYYAVASSIWVAVMALSSEIIRALYKSMIETGVLRKLYFVSSTLLVSFVVIVMFCISLVPHTVVERNIQSQLPSPIMKWHDATSSLEIVNSYGLFRRMTGVGGRPEVIVLGSYDSKEWKEYEFFYKPGDVNRSPPFVAPHQPRLDWQMWFAALGSYHHNPWLLQLAYQLFDNQPSVLSLIQHNPFEESPPKYIKALLYTYHFSDSNSTRSWWIRDDNPTEYFPAAIKDQYEKYFTDNKITINNKPRSAPSSKVDAALREIRQYVSFIDHALFVNSFIMLALFYLLIGKLLIKGKRY